MATYIGVRALNRSSDIRLIDRTGTKVTCTPTHTVVIDFDLPSNRKELAHHSALGQVVVVAANNTAGGSALPPNS